MKLQIQEYQTKKIVNVRKHVDGGWFWDKYSAAPYVGCRSGCEFCYLRGDNYGRYQNPENYDTHIRVKLNAAPRLDHELKRLSRDIIMLGDWQIPVENKYRLSREMLKIALKYQFPVLVIERSPFLLEDLDLLKEINSQTFAGVFISISHMSNNVKQVMEPHSPGLKKRLKMMSRLAEANIPTGTSFMPIFPGFGDSKQDLLDVIQATKDNGGSFVIGAGLTMSGLQAERTYAAVKANFPEHLGVWNKLYQLDNHKPVQYSPDQKYHLELAQKIRDCCARVGIPDRMPRPIVDNRLKFNKALSEQYFLKIYELELNRASKQEIWKYRKAAWAIDELPHSLELMYNEFGETAFQNLKELDASIKNDIVKKIKLNKDLSPLD